MPDSKPTFPVEAAPADYGNKTVDQKIEWLNAHGLASDNTVNLGDCYRRGAKLTHFFSIAYKVLKRLSDAVKNKGSAALKKYLNAFLTAFNNGVGHLSNYIYTNVTNLLATGKFSDEAALLTPVSIPDLPTITDDSKPFDTSFWGTFFDTLKLLIESWPWINKVRPSMLVSYAQLLKDVISRGQTFFVEFQKEQAGDQPHDDESIHMNITSSAVSNGLSRKLGWSSGDDVPAGDDDTTIVELQQPKELAPA